MEGFVIGSKKLTPTSGKNGLKMFVVVFIFLAMFFIFISVSSKAWIYIFKLISVIIEME